MYGYKREIAFFVDYLNKNNYYISQGSVIMKYIFQYGNDKIINLNSVIRQNLDDLFFQYKIAYNDEVAKEMIRSWIIDLYDYNYQIYYLYIQVLLSDAYKMYIYKLNNNILTDSEKAFLDIFDFYDMDFSQIINYIENSEILFNQMLECSMDFNSLSLLGKKTVVQHSRNYEGEINKIIPLYRLDVLEYGVTNTNDLLNYYEDSLNNIVIDPYQLTENISFHMKHLYLYDKEQYLSVLQGICEVFYKWGKYNLIYHIHELSDADKVKEYLNIIENKSLEEIGEIVLRNQVFLLRIIDDFCYYENLKKYDEENEESKVNNMVKDYLPSSLKQKIKK